jgi:hypothetical protein
VSRSSFSRVGGRSGLDADLESALEGDGGASKVSTGDGGLAGEGGLTGHADASATPDAAPVLDPSACLTGGTVWHMDQWLDTPPVTLTVPPALVEAVLTPATAPSQISVEFYTADDATDYQLVLTAENNEWGTPTAPLQVGPYPNGGVNLYANSGGCDAPVGSFDITAMNLDDQYVEELTVAFSYRCPPIPATVYGCAHLEHVPQAEP